MWVLGLGALFAATLSHLLCGVLFAFFVLLSFFALRGVVCFLSAWIVCVECFGFYAASYFVSCSVLPLGGIFFMGLGINILCH